jgi:pantoate--beta-alanine ligase
MEVLQTVDEMVAWRESARKAGRTTGLVPTMGFLHRGHASLLDLVRPRCDRLVVSVYVNPLQFGPNEDLARYPRDPEGDARLCAAHGADAVFMPAELYPPGFSTAVTVHGGVTERWEAEVRPGHFEGVATVVARLFGIVGCGLAAFGEKDWQQLVVLRRMVNDLALPVRILAGPLVRDDDGVALSSRNTYLSADQRARARSLSRALFAMRDAAAAGEREARALEQIGGKLLDVDRVDYLAVVDAETLEPLGRVDRAARALVTARLGATRLLDNISLGPELSWE